MAAPTGRSWSMMTPSHSSQLRDSPAQVARCDSRISSALGIAPSLGCWDLSWCG